MLDAQQNIHEIELAHSKSLESAFKDYSDKELWRAFKDGSEIALSFIYNTHFTALYRYGSQFTIDRNLIKDAIQDMFIELINKRKKLSDTTNIKYYLFKSLRITVIAYLRKNKKLNCYDNFEERLDFQVTLSKEQITLDLQFSNQLKVKMERALGQLTSKQREIIYYYYFEGLTLQEISSLMNFTNLKSTQNLFYRALKSLRACV